VRFFVEGVLTADTSISSRYFHGGQGEIHLRLAHASRHKSFKLRYLVCLYAKELVLRNFVGLPADQLLKRMVELSLRTEEHL